MYILVDETKLEITKHSVQRNKITGQLILTITIPKANATATEIDELRTYIKENAPTITVCNDSDEVVQTFTGFSIEPIFGLTALDEWEIKVENKSELEFQYGRLLDENAELKQTVTKQAETITNQANMILSLNEQLLAVQLATVDLYEKSLVTEEETPVEEMTETEEESEVE